MKNTTRAKSAGTVLLLVLAFLVLLTGLVLAYFVRTTSDRLLASNSSDNLVADTLARSALDVVVGDFKQEIINGSNGSPPYTLKSNLNIVPMRNGSLSVVPNLIRRSVRGDMISFPGVASRASAVNSATDSSLNGRSITPARWNKHYLIPRLNPSSTLTDTTPISDFVAPDWVYVTENGPEILVSPSAGAFGRYSYAVYDEGGLLDLNVAGFPSSTSTDLAYLKAVGRKGVLCFSDLTTIGLSSNAIDNIVGWRNFYNGSPTGEYTAFVFPTNPSQFVQYFLESSVATGQDRTRNFGVVTTPSNYGKTTPRTDQAIINRNELLELRRTLQAQQSAMQSLGSFSCETNKPTWSDAGTKLAARFPLSRFDLFATTPPNSGNATLIQKYFGLSYVPASPGMPPVAEHWQYVGTSGSTLRSSIPSISGTNQNPDLFPLLQYALPTASVGEILSIGASLIDQRDSDINTTWIEYSGGSSLVKAFGVDQIPSNDPTAPPLPPNPVILKRAFRNVGELGYAYRNSSSTLDFRSEASADSPLLDLFSYNVASVRSGIVNLNTRNVDVLASILKGAFATENASTGLSSDAAKTVASRILSDSTKGTASNPAVSRADIARLAAAAAGLIGPTEEEQETVARALSEVTQTRTWTLLVDVIAQSGRFPPKTSNAAQFVVQAERRYWLHIAIDRFTGEVVDRQLEQVFE
jgi:hypothetical protein